MAERLTVSRDGKPIYDIVLETSFGRLGEEVKKLDLGSRKICIVTDSHVAPLYLEEVREILAGCCGRVSVFTFPAGEENKNLDTVRELYEHLIKEHFDRKDVLAALGGGVVGDLCGFAAATYLRGVDFIQIPTTLLSQVDSSIGGKTGVDFDAYKNMVGAFHMPRLVYANLAAFQTLPGEQFASGMGEVIKHGLIRNKAYYEWLKENRERILARDGETCLSMVLESCRIKRQVVEADPTEQGERALLNFGHTLGHAIEKLSNFSLLHGCAVGLGCIAAARISANRGLISMEEAEDIRRTFGAFGLPTGLADGGCAGSASSGAAGGFSWEDVRTAMKSDKKMDSGVVKFILLRKVGEAVMDKTLTEEEIRAGFAYLQGEQ